MKIGRYRAAGLAGFGLVGAIIVLVACSNQSEGDRCDYDNGNDDCGDGLVCVAKSASGHRQNDNSPAINPPYNNADRCCPADRTTATHPACTLGTSTTVTDSAAPTDTGPQPDVVVDAPNDTSETSTDAPADAPDAG